MSNGDLSNGDGPDSGVPLLAARDLTKAHGRTEALRGASVELRAGEILAVTGASGSGNPTHDLCAQFSHRGATLRSGTHARGKRPGHGAPSKRPPTTALARVVGGIAPSRRGKRDGCPACCPCASQRPGAAAIGGVTSAR